MAYTVLIPQFVRERRQEAITYCRCIQKLSLGNPLYKRFRENANANCGMWDKDGLCAFNRRERITHRTSVKRLFDWYDG